MTGERLAVQVVRGRVARAVESAGLAGRRCMVAVSGGVDSVTLLDVLAALSREQGFDLAVGHVNHQLRGKESDGDEASVEQCARRLGVPCLVAAADPSSARTGRSSGARPTLQEAARQVRYAALERLASRCQADVIATAHTADDQAETLLLRMLRGCGPEALVGIPERSRDGLLLRPLLAVSRDEVCAYAAARSLSWREDSSNLNRGYARNRLRHDWLPGLRQDFNPKLVRALGNLASAQQRDEAWMQVEVEREAARRLEWREGELWIECGTWDELPEAMAWRLARHALHEMGCRRDLSHAHLVRLLRGLGAEEAPMGRIEFPGGLRLERRGGRARLFRV